MLIVLDTNVLVSALIKDSITRKIILESKETFLFPEFIFEEIKKHKKEVIKKSGLKEKDYEELLNKLIMYVDIIPTGLIKAKRKEALEIAKNIDINDVLFFATALSFDALIWSDDKALKNQDKVRVLNTKEIKDKYL